MPFSANCMFFYFSPFLFSDNVFCSKKKENTVIFNGSFEGQKRKHIIAHNFLKNQQIAIMPTARTASPNKVQASPPPNKDWTNWLVSRRFLIIPMMVATAYAWRETKHSSFCPCPNYSSEIMTVRRIVDEARVDLTLSKFELRQEIDALATNATQEIDILRREIEHTVYDAVDTVRFVQGDLSRMTNAFDRSNLEVHALRNKLEDMAGALMEIQYSVSLLNESYARSTPVRHEKTFQTIFDAITNALSAQAF